jgi:hypothetical protein
VEKRAKREFFLGKIWRERGGVLVEVGGEGGRRGVVVGGVCVFWC